MLKQLYENFQYWSSSGGIWLYSDPHFNDDDCKLMDADWPTPEEQLEKINTRVHKNDTLIILGDIGDISYIPKIKAGYKILIMGNHDTGASNYKKKITKRIYDAEEYDRNASILIKELRQEFPEAKIQISTGFEFHSPFVRFNVTIDDRMFDEVYSGPLFISDKILLSHEPIDLPFVWNIHGHTHDRAGYDNYDNNHYNVCSNTINYEPILLDNLIKKGFLKRIENIHRITINKATENSTIKYASSKL